MHISHKVVIYAHLTQKISARFFQNCSLNQMFIFFSNKREYKDDDEVITQEEIDICQNNIDDARRRHFKDRIFDNQPLVKEVSNLHFSQIFWSRLSQISIDLTSKITVLYLPNSLSQKTRVFASNDFLER